jgi:hypothetical protein
VYKQNGKTIVPTYLAGSKGDKYLDRRPQLKNLKFYDKKTRRYKKLNTTTSKLFTNVLTEWMSANGNQQGITMKHKRPLSRSKFLGITDIDTEYEI